MSNNITPELDKQIQAFLLSIATEQFRSKHTIVAYKRDIDNFLSFLASLQNKKIDVADFVSLDNNNMRKWLSTRINNNISSTSNARAIAALKSFGRFLLCNKIQVSPKLLNFRRPKISKTLPNTIDSDTVLELIKQVKGTSKQAWQQKRDESLLLLLFSAGLRISEALSLKRDQVANKTTAIRIDGKGRKQRIVPLLETVKESLLEYKECCPFTQFDSELLFVSNKGKHYNARNVQKKIQEARIALGLSDNITPHTMRHACATTLLESSNNINKVSRLLGHSSIATTQIYTHINTNSIANSLKESGYYETPIKQNKASDK